LSTSAQVQTAWESAIWQDATILEITDAIFPFDVTTESESETGRLYSGQELNYFQYTIRRSSQIVALGQIEHQFTVDVQYTRQSSPDGDNWQLVRDTFDTLFDLVRDELGASWTNTVDFWRPQEGAAEITQITLDETLAWRGAYRFTGFQTVSI
jgi:hypothetical protein